jgi:virginiamycin B lyase
MAVFDAPRGIGPYGIATTPQGQVFFASLAGQLSRSDRSRERHYYSLGAACGEARRTARVERQSRRAVDHRLEQRRSFRYDSDTNNWRRWHLPGDSPQPYAVYVDETDAVWVSDWGANAILLFDPNTENFDSFPLPDPYASVRQLAGGKGEIWGAEPAADKLFVIKGE